VETERLKVSLTHSFQNRLCILLTISSLSPTPMICDITHIAIPFVLQRPDEVDVPVQISRVPSTDGGSPAAVIQAVHPYTHTLGFASLSFIRLNRQYSSTAQRAQLTGWELAYCQCGVSEQGRKY
jgi:hypothetical protein